MAPNEIHQKQRINSTEQIAKYRDTHILRNVIRYVSKHYYKF